MDELKNKKAAFFVWFPTSHLQAITRIIFTIYEVQSNNSNSEAPTDLQIESEILQWLTSDKWGHLIKGLKLA